MSTTAFDAQSALAALSAFPAVYNGSLTGAVDVNAAFTLGSGYLVCPDFTLSIYCIWASTSGMASNVAGLCCATHAFQ